MLYTFYPPMQAHPTFYIFATLLIVGSWIWCAVMIRSVWSWRRENRDRPLPLPVHGMLVTVIIWLLATSGLAALAQPYLWFVGMLLFGVVNHIAGMQGMPRRVYNATFLGSEIAAKWQSWTLISAVGGVILFISSLLYLIVLVGTMIVGERGTPPSIEFAIPLEPASEKRGIWDRFPLWTAVAVILILIAYGPPLYHLITMERFGSLPFKPF